MPEQRRPDFCRSCVDTSPPFLYSAFGASRRPTSCHNANQKLSLPSSRPNFADTSAPAGIVRVGPAGWSYPDWAGYVYPSHVAKSSTKQLICGIFDTIEINTSFYQPLRPEHAAQWLDRVAANHDLCLPPNSGNDSRTIFSPYRPALPQRMNAPSRGLRCAARCE